MCIQFRCEVTHPIIPKINMCILKDLCEVTYAIIPIEKYKFIECKGNRSTMNPEVESEWDLI